MGWIQCEIGEFQDLIRGRAYMGGKASIQGITLTSSISDHEEIITPPACRNKADRPADTTRRTAANKARAGQSLERTGTHVRTNELRKRVHAWVDARGGSHRMKFWTVTFPCGTPDHLCFKALNILLTRWRKAVPDLNYCWTAERHENRTAHFHAVSDTYMDVRRVNGWMRATLRNMGNQIPWSYEGQADKYNGITISPPVRSRHGMENYLVKYLTKAVGSGFSQPWHCSRSIGRIATRCQIDHHTVIESVAIEVRRESGRHHLVNALVEDAFIFVPFPSRVNRRIADRLQAHNRIHWQRRYHRSPSRSRAQAVEPPKEQRSPIVQTTGGEQLTLLQVPISRWMSPRNRGRPSRIRAPIFSVALPV